MSLNDKVEAAIWLGIVAAVVCFVAAIHSITPKVNKQETRNEVTK